MNCRYFNNNSKKIILILSCCLVVLITFAIYLHFNKASDIPASGTVPPSIVKNPNSIAIPGYEILELKASSKEQSLCLPNPEQNMCYFEITLYLEDGTLLWKSELIEPGEISKPITLMQELKKGTYPNALLRYACYRMDESHTPLNGAETKVTLWVK